MDLNLGFRRAFRRRMTLWNSATLADALVMAEIAESEGEEQPSIEMPALAQLEGELERVRYKRRYSTVLRSTLYTLVTVAAVAVLVATLWMPVLQIYGNSMTPNLIEGDIVVSIKNSEFAQGDVIAFYYGNKLLVKRCIAGPGSWVNIDEAGNVYVDGQLLDEPYVQERALGDCNIELPYQVPEDRWFVLGDHRATSVDSRNSTVGCISSEQIIGQIVYRVWPMPAFGEIE